MTQEELDWARVLAHGELDKLIDVIESALRSGKDSDKVEKIYMEAHYSTVDGNVVADWETIRVSEQTEALVAPIGNLISNALKLL